MMNKFIKNLSALFLALTVFTVNIPVDSVHALDLIKFTSDDTGTGDDDDGTTGGDDDDDSSGGGSSSDTKPPVPSDQLIETNDLTFTVESDLTFGSSVVFENDDYEIVVSNAASNKNINFEWFVDGDSQGDSNPGYRFSPNFSGSSGGTSYEVYVIGTYEYYIENESGMYTEKVTSGKFTVKVITKPSVDFTIEPSSSTYEVGDMNINTIYLDFGSTISNYTDYSAEWLPSGGALSGGNSKPETSLSYFAYEPPASLTETAGNYTMGVKLYYDHDGDEKTDPALIKTILASDSDAAKITVLSDSIAIKIEGETNYSSTATGTAVLSTTLTGITEADLVGESTGYVWTLDGETIEGEESSTLSINIASLAASSVYAVKAGYIDDDNNIITLTDTITITKGDDDGSGDDDDDGSDDGSGDGSDSDSDNGQTGDGSAYPQFLTDLTVASKVYVQNRVASPLEISVDPRIDGTISYKWYVNTAYSTVGGTLLNYEYGLSGNSSSITPSVTPSTDTVGTFYYYVEVTNHYGEFTKTTRSNIATIQVIADDTAPTKYTVSSTGKLDVADYSKVVVDWSTFDEFIDNDGEVLYVTGAYIQNLRIPAVYSSNGYEVVVKDTGYELEYSWKIKDGSQVSGYLDLALATATSLSGVEKGNSALNYDARYSQIIEFKHEGALTNNDKGITLSMPTTVKDGDGHLNKINDDATIDYNNYVKGSIANGVLTVNMKDCSNWVVSALKLAALSDYDNSDGTGAVTGFVNIPTFVGFEISEFKNVVVGQMIYLDKINMDTIENNRFNGWYYDTAFLEPVSSSDVNSGMLVTREIVTNGLYPKYEKSNSYVPAISTSVPSTGASVFKLQALF